MFLPLIMSFLSFISFSTCEEQAQVQSYKSALIAHLQKEVDAVKNGVVTVTQIVKEYPLITASSLVAGWFVGAYIWMSIEQNAHRPYFHLADSVRFDTKMMRDDIKHIYELLFALMSVEETGFFQRYLQRFLALPFTHSICHDF